MSTIKCYFFIQNNYSNDSKNMLRQQYFYDVKDLESTNKELNQYET